MKRFHNYDVGEGGIFLVILAIVAMVGYTIWFHIKYKCVESHTTVQQQCDTTCWDFGSSSMSNCTTTCSPRRVEVCDHYLPRE